jgi:hypothetical protein
MWWNYYVTQHETRAMLYIDGADPTANKSLFDLLHSQRATVEAAFGSALDWERRNDNRASSIGTSFPGGWADDSTWPRVIEQSVEAMGRLYAILSPLVRDST